MAITQATCTSFKSQLLLSVHDFRPTGDSGASPFKLALYTSSANLDANTTAYTTTNEVVGTNYTAGGAALTNLGVGATNTSPTVGAGFADFTDLVFSNVTLTARGALIYNSVPKALSNSGGTLTNPSVVVLDFGSDKTTTAGDFTIVFPPAASAIIRVE